MPTSASRLGAAQPCPAGRHEPGIGEIHDLFVFDCRDRLGHAGWLGCEYAPLGRTEDGRGRRKSQQA